MLPSFFIEMLNRKWLGDKTKGGFYKKQKSADGDQRLRARLEDAGIPPGTEGKAARAGDGEER